jgi:hypothetical protein
VLEWFRWLLRQGVVAAKTGTVQRNTATVAIRDESKPRLANVIARRFARGNASGDPGAHSHR